jgi:hypothetical protein
VTQEVSKTFDANIYLVEPAYVHDFAIGLNYLFQSVLSLIVAAIVSILSLLLFNLIFKQKVSTIIHQYIAASRQNEVSEYSNIGFSQNE